MDSSKKHDLHKKEVGRWAQDQHQRFMMAIATYGKDWKKVEEIVGTRSGSQVRSHAQKFFNKLLKTDPPAKTNPTKSKKPISTHQPDLEDHDHEHDDNSENSFMKYVHEDASNTTPIELVSLIHGESQKNTEKQVDIKKFQKKLEERMADIKEESDEELAVEALKRQNSYKSMNNILEAYETLKEPDNKANMEDQSFLIGLTKHYKKYFSKGGKFEYLIDFGNPDELQRIQRSIRKRSFTLPEGVEGGEEDLNERKKRVIAEQATAKLTEGEKQSYKQAVEKHINEKKSQNQQNSQSK